MNIGEEETKGNEQALATYPLLKAEEYINFVGNVEGRDINKGTVDVVVCDGFVGNVVLKFAEGLASAIMKLMKEAILNVMTPKKVDHFLEAIKFPIAKCLIVGEPTRLAVLEKEMYEHLKDRMGVFRSEPYFLELVPKGIDKAQSLAVLLKEIGMTKEEMIAVGDGFNDLSMIQYAGLGVAMANAQEIVRQNADYITLSNEEDGVAAVVEKFIL